MSDLNLIETSITSDHVRLRYADKADLPNQWIDFRLPLATMMLPIDPDRELGDIEKRLVAEVRLSALRALRELVGAEIQRLSDREYHRH